MENLTKTFYSLAVAASNQKSDSSYPMEKITKACCFAAFYHRNQKRKNKEKSPYIVHPFEVAKFLACDCGITDEDVICAGVLHDTVEDVGVTYDQLKTEFGERVAKFIMECTDDKSLHKVERKKLQIEHAKHISNGARLVKAADKLSNLSGLDSDPPAKWSKDEIEGYFVWAYAVWFAGLKGVSAFLDAKLGELFAKRGLIGLPEKELSERLEKYYSLIKNSEFIILIF